MKPYHPTYSLMHALFADDKNPTPQKRRDYQITCMYSGLHAIERGTAPVPHHWRVICDAVNMLETLILQGHVKDEQGLLKDASTSLANAARRYRHGKELRLDAQGIGNVRAVLEDYCAALESLSYRVMVHCHRATEKRIWEIHHGQNLPHDIEVITL